MRELDCDFCGSPAAGAYEVGPKPPDRSPTDRRRLVLCTDCRETLAVAIQPLLDRVAAAESDASPGDGGAVNTPSTDDSSSANTPSTDDSSSANTPSTDDGEETDSDERIVSNAEPNTERLTGDDDTTDASGGETSTVESGATETESETGEAGSETAETESETPETTSETTQAGHTATDPRRNGTADRPTTDSDDESASEEQTDRGDSSASSGSSESSRTGGEPPEFRRVMRLLNNRTFPVDRAEFTDLATGAYGLAESEVDRIVEYAVQRGVLAVEDGELRRG